MPPTRSTPEELYILKNIEKDDLVFIIDERETRALTPEENEHMADQKKDPAYQQWMRQKEAEAEKLFNLRPSSH